jgi:hypothetical protein
MRCESSAAAERDVLGKPDGAHAALADLLEDSVRPICAPHPFVRFPGTRSQGAPSSLRS